MSKKISQLNEVTTVLDTDVLPVVNGGETKKATKANFLKEIRNSVNELSTLVATKADILHTHSLDALSDVVITSPTNGQVLKWDGSNWVNATIALGITIGQVIAGAVIARLCPFLIFEKTTADRVS